MNNNLQQGLTLEIPKHVMLILQAWRDMGDTEVTGFFITKKGHPLKVVDAVIIEATCTPASVDIKPKAITAMYAEQIKQGIYPDQLQIWWHTHPGNSPQPSGQDWATFKELCRDRTLNVMYILARGDQEFAHIGVTDLKSGITVSEDLAVKHHHTNWTQIKTWAELEEEFTESVKVHAAPTRYSLPYVRNNDTTFGLECPPHAHTELFDVLPSEDQHCFLELYGKVRRHEITPDEADIYAAEQCCGADFFTDIYNDEFMMAESDSIQGTEETL